MNIIIVIFATCFTLVLGVSPEYIACLKRFSINKQIYATVPPTPLFTDKERICAQACVWETTYVWYPNGTLYQELIDSDTSPLEDKADFWSVYNSCKDGYDNCKRMMCMVKLYTKLRYSRRSSQT